MRGRVVRRRHRGRPAGAAPARRVRTCHARARFAQVRVAPRADRSRIRSLAAGRRPAGTGRRGPARPGAAGAAGPAAQHSPARPGADRPAPVAALADAAGLPRPGGDDRAVRVELAHRQGGRDPQPGIPCRPGVRPRPAERPRGGRFAVTALPARGATDRARRHRQRDVVRARRSGCRARGGAWHLPRRQPAVLLAASRRRSAHRLRPGAPEWRAAGHHAGRLRLRVVTGQARR
jgi:hypothetical protein